MRPIRFPDPLYRTGPRVGEPDGNALRRIVAELTLILQEMNVDDGLALAVSNLQSELDALDASLGTAAFVDTGTGAADVPTTAAADARYVGLTGDQTVTGTKTFSAAVVLSTAGTAATHAVRADRSVSAGDGLTGGGTLEANRTFSVDGTVVRTTRTMTAGDGLTGGGTLEANRTFSVDGTVIRNIKTTNDITVRCDSGFFQSSPATIAGGWPINAPWMHLITSTHSSTANYYSLQLAGDFFSQRLWFRNTQDNGFQPWSGIVDDQSTQTIGGAKTFSSAVTLSTAGTGSTHAVRADRTLTAGDGLTGGGNLQANRTITMGTPGTITATSTNSVSTTSHTHALNNTDQPTAGTIMSRDGLGDTWARLFRSSFTGTNATIAGIYTTQVIGGDYMRPSTPAQVMAAVGATRTITAGTGLTGGGNLGGNITVNMETSFGAVGTYVFAGQSSTATGNISPGETIAGSLLRPAGIKAEQDFTNLNPTASAAHGSINSGLSGTWRCMGMVRAAAAGQTGATLFMRIS